MLREARLAGASSNKASRVASLRRSRRAKNFRRCFIRSASRVQVLHLSLNWPSSCFCFRGAFALDEFSRFPRAVGVLDDQNVAAVLVASNLRARPSIFMLVEMTVLFKLDTNVIFRQNLHVGQAGSCPVRRTGRFCAIRGYSRRCDADC